MKYRKKPDIVDAVQFTGANATEVLAVAEPWKACRDDKDGYLTLYLGGRVLTMTEGEWLLRDVTGRLDTCRNEVFALLWEAMP